MVSPPKYIVNVKNAGVRKEHVFGQHVCGMKVCGVRGVGGVSDGEGVEKDTPHQAQQPTACLSCWGGSGVVDQQVLGSGNAKCRAEDQTANYAKFICLFVKFFVKFKDLARTLTHGIDVDEWMIVGIFYMLLALVLRRLFVAGNGDVESR